MSEGDWLREERGEAAVDKLLDAAAQAFMELGVKATTMADVCRYAGCSRATLYRYFENRQALRVAFVNRETLRMSAAVGASTASIDDPRERLVEAVLRSVASVRATPHLAAWFTAEDMSVPTEMSQSDDVLSAVGGLFAQSGADAEQARMGARWVIRVIISLLVMPGSDEAEERAMVDRFVAPALVERV